MCRTPLPRTPLSWSSDSSDDDDAPAISAALQRTKEIQATKPARKLVIFTSDEDQAGEEDEQDQEECSLQVLREMSGSGGGWMRRDIGTELREEISDFTPGEEKVWIAANSAMRRVPSMWPTRQVFAVSSDEDASGDEEYLSAVEVVISSDEEEALTPPLSAKTRMERELERERQANKLEKELEDLFSRATVSGYSPVKRRVDETAFFTSDSDSDSPPPKPRRKPIPSPQKQGTAKKTFKELSVFEAAPPADFWYEGAGAISDDLTAATISYPGRQKPLVKPKATAPKKFTRIPATPHKQESDEFWDQHATDNWTDLHSPQNNSLGRTLRILSDSEGEKDGYSPDDYLSDSASVVSTMTTITNMMPKSMKPVSAADRKSKRDWDSRKNELAESFIQELDREINNGEVGCYYNNHGGITLEWNSKLRTTAGRAKLVKGVIELSGKVITCEDRLYNTVAHEYCHLAVWAISKERRDTHGPVFKQWGARVSQLFSHLGVQITTKHSYEIEFKYRFNCQTPQCGYFWDAHSNPKDMDRRRCPTCRIGILLQVRPADKPLSEYNRFTRQHMARIKQENPSSPMKEVMSILGQEWKEHKALQTDMGSPETRSGGLGGLMDDLKL